MPNINKKDTGAKNGKGLPTPTSTSKPITQQKDLHTTEMDFEPSRLEGTSKPTYEELLVRVTKLNNTINRLSEQLNGARKNNELNTSSNRNFLSGFKTKNRFEAIGTSEETTYNTSKKKLSNTKPLPTPSRSRLRRNILTHPEV